jgi:hypothetical protein
MTAARLGCACLVATLFAGGCDSTSGIAGIDGTGAPVVTDNALAYGLVTETNAFAVNGVRYDTSAAKVTVDGDTAVAADIALGDIARVIAKPDVRDPSNFVADNVVVDDAVEGPIASIDAATSTVIALGQTIRVTPTTLFDASVLPPSLAGLAVGQTIEVAGFRGSNGDIFASRIERKPAAGNFETTGTVTGHNAVARRFMINGLVVSYAAAAFARVRNGDIVEVRGSQLLAGGALAAAYVELAAPVAGGAGDRVDIQGYVTTFAGQAPGSFDVAGVHARTTSQTVVVDVDLALDAKVAVKGTLDSSGTVVASDLRRGGYPGPTSGPYTVVGQVFDAYSGGVPNASMNLWVQQGRGGYSYVWANGQFGTNSAGEFIAPNIPESQLSFWAVKQGFVQPCAVNAAVPPSGVVQIELVAESTLAALDPPRPLLVLGTVLTGTVFETVNGARQPVAGAGVEVNTENDIVVATTKTDLQGRFFLCNVPSRALLYVGKAEFELRDIWVPDTVTASPLEVELHR